MVGGAVVGGAVVGGAVVGWVVVGGAVVGWVVVACDDALADAVGCLLADGDAEADALLVLVTDEICAAGDGVGVGVCPCELRAKAAPAPPSTSTPMTAASTSGRDRRRRGPAVPDGGSLGASGGEPLAGVDQASVAWYGGVAAKSAIEVCVAAKPGTSGMGTAVGAGVPSTAVGAGCPGGGVREGGAAAMRMTESGSQFPVGWRAPTASSRATAVGRCAGSLTRQRSISGRTAAGTPSRSGVSWTTRYSSEAVVPPPNGPLPVAAKASTVPRLKMSLGGPTSVPMACSGDMNPGDPIVSPVWVSVVDSAAREMPKSMTRGPSSASSTFDGFRSRCVTPAAWIAASASASPAASASSDASGSGPCSFTASASEGPGT